MATCLDSKSGKMVEITMGQICKLLRAVKEVKEIIYGTNGQVIGERVDFAKVLTVSGLEKEGLSASQLFVVAQQLEDRVGIKTLEDFEKIPPEDKNFLALCGETLSGVVVLPNEGNPQNIMIPSETDDRIPTDDRNFWSEWNKLAWVERRCDVLFHMTPDEWYQLAQKVGVMTGKTGETIKRDFFAFVGHDMRLWWLCQPKLLPDQYSMIYLFHDIQDFTKDGIKETLDTLLDNDILASASMSRPLEEWMNIFLSTFDNEQFGADFFHTTTAHLTKARTTYRSDQLPLAAGKLSLS